MAERQGRYVAELLNSKKPSESQKAFSFKSMGMLAYIGGYEALSDLPEFKLKGFCFKCVIILNFVFSNCCTANYKLLLL